MHARIVHVRMLVVINISLAKKNEKMNTYLRARDRLRSVSGPRLSSLRLVLVVVSMIVRHNVGKVAYGDWCQCFFKKQESDEPGDKRIERRVKNKDIL